MGSEYVSEAFNAEFPVVSVAGDGNVRIEVRRALDGVFFYGRQLQGTYADYLAWRAKQRSEAPSDNEILDDMRRCGCPGRVLSDLRRPLRNTLALAAAKRFTESQRADVCVLALMGPPGVGKSVAAGDAMRAFGKRVGSGNRDPRAAPPYLWIQATALTGLSAFDDAQQLWLKDLERCGLLVIDELGSDGCSAWGRAQVTNLILARYGKNKPTVVTSNLTRADFRQQYGGALADRFKSSGVDVDLSHEKTMRGRAAA